MPPEIASEAAYGKSADIWSLGCVLFDICALRPAFTAFNVPALLDKVKSGRVPLLPRRYSQGLRDLARSMLFATEARRPTAAEVLASPVLAVRTSIVSLCCAELPLCMVTLLITSSAFMAEQRCAQERMAVRNTTRQYSSDTTHLHMQDARARVNEMFGPEQAPGDSPAPYSEQRAPSVMRDLLARFRADALETDAAQACHDLGAANDIRAQRSRTLFSGSRHRITDERGSAQRGAALRVQRRTTKLSAAPSCDDSAAQRSNFTADEHTSRAATAIAQLAEQQGSASQGSTAAGQPHDHHTTAPTAAATHAAESLPDPASRSNTHDAEGTSAAATMGTSASATADTSVTAPPTNDHISMQEEQTSAALSTCAQSAHVRAADTQCAAALPSTVPMRSEINDNGEDAHTGEHDLAAMFLAEVRSKSNSSAMSQAMDPMASILRQPFPSKLAQTTSLPGHACRSLRHTTLSKIASGRRATAPHSLPSHLPPAETRPAQYAGLPASQEADVPKHPAVQAADCSSLTASAVCLQADVAQSDHTSSNLDADSDSAWQQHSGSKASACGLQDDWASATSGAVVHSTAGGDGGLGQHGDEVAGDAWTSLEQLMAAARAQRASNAAAAARERPVSAGQNSSGAQPGRLVKVKRYIKSATRKTW